MTARQLAALVATVEAPRASGGPPGRGVGRLRDENGNRQPILRPQ